MWTTLELYEGPKPLKKVKLSKLMNEFGSFKVKDNETIKESESRFQKTINSLKLFGKVISQEEINMQILSAVP